jgi:hypothetical protein
MLILPISTVVLLILVERVVPAISSKYAGASVLTPILKFIGSGSDKLKYKRCDSIERSNPFRTKFDANIGPDMLPIAMYFPYSTFL